LVVLASGYGSNLQAILDACEHGALQARVAAVISDRPEANALERAKRAGVPALLHAWDSYRQAGRDRRKFDADLADLAESFGPDFIVLAGWMRLLTSAFLDRFPQRVINLHPALPGAFAGTRAIERAWQAYLAGELTSTGVMVHFVPDEGIDNGPVILQETVPIISGDTLETLTARLHAVEHRILLEALKQVLKSTLLENNS
jgi:formyltetrahydrofolate-dependent phosphoribosylglycinamide formyltransferase